MECGFQRLGADGVHPRTGPSPPASIVAAGKRSTPRDSPEGCLKPPVSRRRCRYLFTDLKYVFAPWVSAFMVGLPSVQLAGQTSPCLATNWKALITRRV